ncbi:MAG: hypothetical protein KKA62_03175 [Nanoarchaeota archaeon]|nr:hypothetical protein [Nanoarchaeota archaeon]MBU1643732.1 hypothetical protein [Nanoarchaeota archaeon]MBU1976928.1 hypothetical protein [Nanoarchaeota archaeon]
MALFSQNKQLPISEVNQLRQQGLTDDIIMQELSSKGFSADQIGQAISQADTAYEPDYSAGQPPEMGGPSFSSPEMSAQQNSSSEMGNIYERIEEITESMIDEKWDELIGEVKKIIEWKGKIEEAQTKINSDLMKLKDDFKVLHQGVLGKLEDYDTRMQDVGTELKAVGKVFKDVIPTFVENVKDLSKVTSELKEKKK